MSKYGEKTKIKKLRKKMGLSCEEVGKLLGISKSGYLYKEKGERPFKICEMVILSKLFQKSIEELL